MLYSALARGGDRTSVPLAEVALHVNVRSGDISIILYLLPKQSGDDSITLRMQVCSDFEGVLLASVFPYHSQSYLLV